MKPLHLWLMERGGRPLVLCGAEVAPHGETCLRPAAVTCPLCSKRLTQWNGRSTGLPPWTAYQVDAESCPGRLKISRPGEGDAIAYPGDWLLDLGGRIGVLPALAAGANA